MYIFVLVAELKQNFILNDFMFCHLAICIFHINRNDRALIIACTTFIFVVNLIFFRNNGS